jgi:hypothetical protein
MLELEIAVWLSGLGGWFDPQISTARGLERKNDHVQWKGAVRVVYDNWSSFFEKERVRGTAGGFRADIRESEQRNSLSMEGVVNGSDDHETVALKGEIGSLSKCTTSKKLPYVPDLTPAAYSKMRPRPQRYIYHRPSPPLVHIARFLALRLLRPFNDDVHPPRLSS